MEIILLILVLIIVDLWLKINGLKKTLEIFSKSLTDMASMADQELDDIKMRIDDLENNMPDNEDGSEYV